MNIGFVNLYLNSAIFSEMTRELVLVLTGGASGVRDTVTPSV
jgi:hypothetical protein